MTQKDQLLAQPPSGGSAVRREGIKVKPGLVIRIRGLRWSAGWEFDCPTAIIAPVARYYEDGRSLEGAIEDLLIDACIEGVLKDRNDAEFWTDGRGWSPQYLRRKYYRKGVERVDVRVRFILDEHGELFWEELGPQQGPAQPPAGGCASNAADLEA